jgi:hypothetical protein
MRHSDKLAKSREWRPLGAPTTDSTANVTIHTNGNVNYNFIKEYEKDTMLESYTEDSQSVKEFKQILFRRTTLCMTVSNRLAKQSSSNCYLKI